MLRHLAIHRKWWVAFREDYNLILIEQYLVWRHFIFRILPSKIKIANKMISIKEMPCNLLALEDCILRTAFIQQTLKYLWPRCFARRRDIEMKVNACLWEGPSRGVALQNSLVCPYKFNLHQHSLVFLLVEMIDQALGILKSKVCLYFFFLFEVRS